MSSPYSVPRGPLKLVRYVRGSLTGKTEQLAANGEEYPQLKWKTELKTVKIGEDGRYCFMPEDKLTALFGAGVTMKNIRYQIWDGSMFVDEGSP